MDYQCLHCGRVMPGHEFWNHGAECPNAPPPVTLDPVPRPVGDFSTPQLDFWDRPDGRGPR